MCGNWGPGHYRTEGVGFNGAHDCCLQLMLLPLWLQAYIALLTCTCNPTHHPPPPPCKGKEKSVQNSLKTYFLFQLVKRELYCCITIRVDFLRLGWLGLRSEWVNQIKVTELDAASAKLPFTRSRAVKGGWTRLKGLPSCRQLPR